MSSLEIAKLTGKRHADVLRDIRVFLEDLGESTERKFASSYGDTTGRTLPCYELPKRECLGLASGYDAKLRMMIIDRWAELEAKEMEGPLVVFHCRAQFFPCGAQLPGQRALVGGYHTDLGHGLIRLVDAELAVCG